MNFDMNTLSTLMQFMGAQKPQPPKSDNDEVRDNFDNANTRTNVTQSVFAMQNGLGQRVDFEEKKPKKTNSSSAQNPMSSLLGMMSGGGGGDMMSNLLPMLLNMMGGKNTQTAKAANNVNDNDSKTSNKNESQSNTAEGRKEDVQKQKTATENNDKSKTQSRDKYTPIAFAGYALISALNKLYIAKALHSDNRRM